MFPKELRLSTDKIRTISVKGQQLRTDFLRMKFYYTTESTSGFALLISKKIIPTATGRNRTKRLLRNAILQSKSQLSTNIQAVISLTTKPPEFSLQSFLFQVESLFGLVTKHRQDH